MKTNYGDFENTEGGQHAGLNELIQAEKRNLDTQPAYDDAQPVSKYDEKEFNWMDSLNCYGADASELKQDAGDQIIFTTKAGLVFHYSLVKTYRTHENEILYWKYASTETKTCLVIFND